MQLFDRSCRADVDDVCRHLRSRRSDAARRELLQQANLLAMMTFGVLERKRGGVVTASWLQTNKRLTWTKLHSRPSDSVAFR